MEHFKAFYHGSLLGEFATQAEADDAVEELRMRDRAEAQDYHLWLSQKEPDPNPNRWRQS